MDKQNYQTEDRFCHHCGNSLQQPESLMIEYWVAEKTVCFCWCHCCGWKGEVSDILKFTASEVSED